MKNAKKVPAMGIGKAAALAVLILSVLCGALPATGQQLYKWKDARGAWHFTDQMPDSEADRDRTENKGDFHEGTLQRLSEEVAAKVIERCAQQWPGQYSMQVYCRDRQIKGAQDLAAAAGTNKDIPADKYKAIFSGCVQRWRRDFAMMAYCVENEAAAYRRLAPRN